MPEKEHPACSQCGQRIRPYNPHSMDKRKVALLNRIAMMNAAGHPWVKVQRDGTIIPPEERPFTIQCDDVHALRLKWFKLVQSKGRRTGLYRATSLGLAFLCGKIPVPQQIWCRDGFVDDYSPVMVYVHQVRDVVYDKPYWDEYALHQKYTDDIDKELPLWANTR